MSDIGKGQIRLAGLALKKKTFNANGQSAIDCGTLWQEFEKRNIVQQITNRIGDEIFAVYYDYEGDHTKPYAYFIGCRIQPDAGVPEGLDSLRIPSQDYRIMKATGKIPDCIAAAWQQIWTSDIPRAYKYDFEIYDERSRNWQAAEVDIFLSVTAG
jgi:predicted transcriptional regulator YdeE